MTPVTGFAPYAANRKDVVQLSMQRLWLTGQILPAGARLMVQHVFRCKEDKPIEVIYAFPLPRDGALRRFRISGENFEAHSEFKQTEEAIKQYERGISRGSLSSLVRQYGDGIMNLTVGNIRPQETVTVELEILCGVELRDDGFRFRYPFTLAPAYHPRARATLTAAGEGEMELPFKDFGDVILPRYRADASALHQIGFDVTIAGQLDIDEIGSPSHTVRIQQAGGKSVRVSLAAEKGVPNSDLVLDARFEPVEPQVLAGRDESGKVRFAAIVPSSSFGVGSPEPRRVVILLDQSGSMQGTPIEQASKAIEACLGALSETDLFGLVAFGDSASSFQPVLVPGTRRWRDQAREFLTRTRTMGGTELAKGVVAAAELLKGGGGDVLILTDGQVSGTEEILATSRAAGVRLHCLGIGSASQDRFLTLLARETRGESRFVTPRERIDLCAVELFASMGRPIVSGLTAPAHIQPQPPAAVFSGTPVLVFGEAAGGDQIEFSWTGGEMKLPIHFSETNIGTTLWLLQGSRLITDWESRYSPQVALSRVDKRKNDRVRARLLELSQTYGLASREMSLVAVVTRPADRAGELPETQVVPVGMPQDTKFGAYFGALKGLTGSFADESDELLLFGGDLFCSALPGAPPPPPPAPPSTGFFRSLFSKSAPKTVDPDAALLQIASSLDPDGGMPAKDPDTRAARSLVALLAFLSQGHTQTSGAFRSHVGRLVAFLGSLTGLSKRHQQILDAVLDGERKSSVPPGDWITLVQKRSNYWKELERTLEPVSR